MVDSAHEQQVKYFPERLVKMVTAMMGIFIVMKLMSKIGVFALNPRKLLFDDKGKLPAQSVALARAAIASSDSHFKAMIAESESVYAAATQPAPTLGDLPLVFISRGQPDANAVPPSLALEIHDEYERAWQELQRQIKALSTRGRRFVAEGSEQSLIFEPPEIIIKSILEMINVSGSRGLPGIKDADVGTNPAQNPFTSNVTDACTETTLQATNLS